MLKIKISRAGDIAVKEHFPSMCKALGSISSTIKK
jgi:hypothetical protein